MSDQPQRGFDAAQVRREEDDLDRWRFAADLVDVITSTPADWSVRIGIFGKWGEGKSTVLGFAEYMLKKTGNITFTFSPWAIRNWEDLWEDFGDRLVEALSAADIPLDSSWKERARDSGRWLETKGVAQAAQMAASLLGKDRFYDAAFSALGRWLKYDGAQIAAIRKELGDRRLVVLIDDLDRCAPQLLPQLLLSLRELLDLPGFTFLLAFDEEIVARALRDENPAWIHGSDFLEKILDFRFNLPPITPKQKQRFIFKALARFCAFVPQSSVEGILDLLPDNPRKLKALIRSMAALSPQISRHDADELNWVDMWLAQMLRLESFPFFQRLLQGGTLEKEAGPLYELTRNRSPRLGTKEQGEENQSLRRLFDEVDIKDPATIARLTKLVEAARARASTNFRYMCEIASRPHAVTWKEFLGLRSVWVADPRPAVLASWIAKHAEERSITAEDVETELYEAIINRRNHCLSIAADSSSIEEHDAQLQEASVLLDMLKQYLSDLRKFSAPAFGKIYGQTSYWIGFRRNVSDKAMRERERALLLDLLSTASEGLSPRLLEPLIPEGWHGGVDPSVTELQNELRTGCLEVVAPRAANEAILLLGRVGGVQLLTEPKRFLGLKHCLFRPNSPIWDGDLRDKLLKAVAQGRSDFDVYMNVRNLFDLLVEGLQHGMDSIRREDFSSVLSDVPFVQCLWQTVTSKSIQYRMQITFLRARLLLIQNGVPEASLPLTEELRLRLAEQDSEIQTQPR